MNAKSPPKYQDHCYDGPTPPLGNSLSFDTIVHHVDETDEDAVAEARASAAEARATVWDHARGDTPEAEQDDGLELLDALGLFSEPA